LANGDVCHSDVLCVLCRRGRLPLQYFILHSARTNGKEWKKIHASGNNSSPQEEKSLTISLVPAALTFIALNIFCLAWISLLACHAGPIHRFRKPLRLPSRGQPQTQGALMKLGYRAYQLQASGSPKLPYERAASTFPGFAPLSTKQTSPNSFPPSQLSRDASKRNIAHYQRPSARIQATGKQLNFPSSKTNPGPRSGREDNFPG